MSRASRARRIAMTAAYGSGGLGLLGSAVIGVILAEIRLARHSIGEAAYRPPATDGIYGHSTFGRRNGIPIRFAVLGDSSAAGLGVDDAHETTAALVAAGVAAVTNRPVRLINAAVVGAVSADLDAQVTRALEESPEVALIMVGANDVTHRVRPSVSVRYLEQAVRRLRGAGCEVVVGTCPDLGTVEPMPQPLRWIARRMSRQLAAAQTIAVVEAGGRTVSLGDILGPEFQARPSEMFSSDRFHPSALGYARAAMALMPSVCASLGFWPADEEQPDAHRDEGVLPIAVAAVEAADEAGTEVAGTRVGGKERGPRGRWAQLRHRRREQLPEVEELLEADAAEDERLKDVQRADGTEEPPDGAFGDKSRLDGATDTR